VIHNSDSQAVEPAMPAKNILLNLWITEEEGHRVGLDSQDGDEKFVSESLEAAVGRGKCSGNADFDFQPQASPKLRSNKQKLAPVSSAAATSICCPPARSSTGSIMESLGPA
jgi:hypothetical protein